MFIRLIDMLFLEKNDRHESGFDAYQSWSFSGLLVISVQFLLYIRLELATLKAPLTSTPLGPYWSIRSVKLRDPDRFVGWQQNETSITVRFPPACPLPISTRPIWTPRGVSWMIGPSNTLHRGRAKLKERIGRPISVR